MTSLTLHIEYLLQRHDCVILPGIGALVVEHVPAHLDEKEGVMYAPTRIISLNASISHDDGMLASSVSRREGIPFEMGRAAMQGMIQEIITILRSEREYAIGRIGLLQLGEEDRLQFIPMVSPQRDALALGFNEARTDVPEVTPMPQPEAQSAAAEAHLAEVQNEESRFDTDRNYYVPINKRFAHYAASVVVLIVALAFMIPRSQTAPTVVKASMNPVESLLNASEHHASHLTPESQDMAGVEKSGAEKGAIELPAIDAEEMNSAAAFTESGMHYLIVATFNTRSEAEKFMNAREGGSYSLELVKGRNVWRISAGHGDTASLRSLLSTPEFRAAFSEAWIWKAE